MKKLGAILFACLCMGNIGMGQDFYDINSIQTVELLFVETNWDQILDNLYAAGDEERLIGTAIINGVQYDSVGVRYKGNSSYRPDQVKNPLNIKLDHIIDDQEIEGYGTLKLANVFKDPSFVREVLSYEIARDYMPAGQANFINVYINGNLIGLYTSVQDVDKLFMRTHFYNDENARFKGELHNAGPQDPVVIWGYNGTDSSDYFNLYEIESDSGWNKLVNFLDIFNNNPADIADVLDVDNHLWMLAYDILMVNLDAPVNFGHNYYLFEDGAGQFNPILWDLNENFGVFSRLLSGGQLSVSDMQQLDPYLHSTHPDYPIINKILTDPAYQRMYIAHMRTLIEERFENNWYETRALEIQSIIDTDVQADPNKFYSYSDFLNNIDNSVGGGPQSIVGITQLMAGRLTYLNNLSDFQATPPTIANISNDPETVTPNSTVWITADVSSASTVKLCFRQNIIDRFDKIEMYDDGAHNDGSAGDGTYGVSVLVGSSDMQYYIYAENGNAAMFSPQRAEYEFYSLPIAGGIVINEFLADNVGSWADQDDEYDDWVELYNGGGEAVSLSGYYLTDDVADLLQWPFPDTSIEAGGYLIIWADNDEVQAGLHANFKLSASGETIILVDPSHAVADEIVFGQQSEDISFGRYPDGGLDMISMYTTPANSNTDNLPPMISGVERNPASPGPGGDVYVTAEVVDDNSIDSVLLVYDIGSGFVDSTMYDDGFHNDGVAGDDVYGGIIPGQQSETIVQYYIYAFDDEEASRKNPLDAPESMHSYIVGLAAKPLFLNEFMASNSSIIQDPQGEYEDWIEIYNAGATSIDLGGMYLTDDLSDPTQWMFPDTSIEAGGHVIVWADEDGTDPGLHANFKLGASGEQVGLFETDENGNVPIDTLSFGEQSTDISFGRCPDGSASWMFFTSPTPGTVNSCCGEPPVLFIN
ncbi:MAG: hypothetical protein GY839_17600 [candidate division Zixibacteria bacterium]|nr:hypothetical protein [candidate division Zixibacteria bacterium]